MSRWPTVPLGEVLTATGVPTRVQPEDTYPLLGVRLAGRGAFLRETKKGSESAATTLTQVSKGDFIYSRLFAWQGAFGLIEGNLAGSFVSGEFPVYSANPKRLDPRYLFHWFRLPSTLKRVERDCSGSTPLTRNRFKERFFLALETPLPPLDEQNRLVKRLDAAAERVRTVRALRTRQREEMAALIVRANEVHQQRAFRLEEALALQEDRVSLAADTTYPQVGIKGFGGGLFKKSGVTAQETTYSHFNRLHAGQFVVSQVKGWEGAVAVCDEDHAGLFASPEYRTFACRPGVLRPDYLSHLSRTAWFHAQLATLTRGQGARRERLRPEMLLSLTLPLPSTADQARLESAFERAVEAASSTGADDLDRLLPAMLHKAFN